ncbi:MFS transporter [Microbulbifer epialgicus]|uniref:MFS transporter n=1 Tax=Microbulbifer epialgicus TaxID=393907 RepID=A0ABV4P2E6_9GAMM
MRILACVLLCHFLSAFSVLGMPLFMPRMLGTFGSEAPDYLIGILFALPSICTAMAAAFWGRFADRYGKRTSLLRAQLGLTMGFLLCGFADSLGMFILGLLVQGLCGGTLAASNAYLATQLKGQHLTNSLNLTQLSARVALIVGPIALGFFTQLSEPLLLYRGLALLPLLALLATLWLPVDSSVVGDKQIAENGEQPIAVTQLAVLQFLFCFSMVVTYPYFLPYAEMLGLTNDSLVGLLYSLPHLVYALLLIPIGKLSWSAMSKTVVGLSLLATSGAMQSLTASTEILVLARLLFGSGILMTYNGLHLLITNVVSPANSGTVFGQIDASGKWAGVAAGILAGIVVAQIDIRMPFLLSVVSALLAISLLRIFNKGKTTREYQGCA